VWNVSGFILTGETEVLGVNASSNPFLSTANAKLTGLTMNKRLRYYSPVTIPLRHRKALKSLSIVHFVQGKGQTSTSMLVATVA
jgi:hypothetical protein